MAAAETPKPKSDAAKDLTKAQANYKGNSYFDLVKVTFVKDTNHYKKGDTDIVHPTVAEIFKAKGFITGYEKYTAPKPEKTEE